jgi:hypothetical protein
MRFSFVSTVALCIAVCFLIGCERACVSSDAMNCSVNQENYKLLENGMPLDTVYAILGASYSHLPEVPRVLPEIGSPGRYIWHRLIPGNVRGKQTIIVIEFVDGKLFSKEIEESIWD